MKKKIILIVCFIGLFLFYNQILTFAFKIGLNYVFKNKIEAHFSYDKIKRQRGGWEIQNFQCQKKDAMEVCCDNVLIKTQFSFKEFRFLFHIESYYPHIKIYDKFPQLLEGQKRSFVSLDLKEALISYEGKKKRESFHLNWQQEPYKSDGVIRVYPKRKESPSLEISFSHHQVFYGHMHFHKFDLSDFQTFFRIFLKSFPEEAKGKISGYVAYQKQKKIEHLFTNLKLEDGDLVLEKGGVRLKIPKLQIQAEYPKQSKERSHLVKCFPVEFLTMLQMDLKFDGIEIASIRKAARWSLHEISGVFFYNPGVGPKWTINALALSNQKKQKIETEGKGFLNSLYSNWIEGNVRFYKKQKQICQAYVKLFDKEDQTIHIATKLENISETPLQVCQDLIKGFYPIFSDPVIKKMKLSTHFDAYYDAKKIWRVNFEKFQADNLEINWGQKLSYLSLDSLSFVGNFDLAHLESLSGKLEVSQAKLAWKNSLALFEEVNASAILTNGCVDTSSVHFSLNQITSSLQCSGPLHDLLVKAHLKGSSKKLFEWFPEKITHIQGYEILDFESSLILKESSLTGSLEFFDQKKALQDTFTFALFLDVGKKDIQNFFTGIRHGWIKGENVFLKRFHINDYAIKGIAQLSASFQNEKISFLLKGENIQIQNEDFSISIPKLGNEKTELFTSDKCFQCTFHTKEKTWNAHLPLKADQCLLKNFSVDFKEIEGAVAANNYATTLKIHHAISHDIHFKGNVLFQNINAQSTLLSIDTEEMQGNIEDFFRLSSHFKKDLPSLKGLKGKFQSGKGGFQLTCHIKEDPILWHLKAEVFEGSYPIASHAMLKKLQGTFTIHSDSLAIIENLTGDVFTQQDEKPAYFLSCPYFCKNKEDVDFDFRLSTSMLDILRVLGKAKKKQDEIEIYFDRKATHFFSTKLNVQNFHIKDKEILSLEMHPILKLDDISHKAFFLRNFIDVKELLLPFSFYAKGDLQCKIGYYKEKESCIEIEGKDLVFLRKNIKNFYLQAKKIKDLWEIPTLKIDEIHSSFKCRKKEDQFEFFKVRAKLKDYFSLHMNFNLQENFQINGNLEDLQIHMASLKYLLKKKVPIEGMLKGSGRFSIDLPSIGQKCHIESDLDLQTSHISYKDFACENKGPIQIYFSLTDGLIIDGLTLHFFHPQERFTWLDCKIGKLHHQKDGDICSYKDVHLQFPKNFFKKISSYQGVKKIPQLDPFFKFGKHLFADSEIVTQGEFNEKTLELTFQLNEHRVTYKNHPYYFQDIDLKISPNSLKVTSKCLLDNFSIPFSARLSLQEKIIGNICFCEKGQTRPMCLDFDFQNGFQIHSIVGAFHGMDARFQKKGDLSFVGSLKCDFEKIADFSPPLLKEFFTELKMGKGYEFRGTLDFSKDPTYQFEGIFTGKECKLAGCVFQTLLSDAKITPDAMTLKELKISDKSGIFKIDQFDIYQLDNRWYFRIPTLTMTEFRPSFLQKIGQKTQEIKPLVFRKILLQDIHGDLEDKASYMAKGNLSFVNSFKRNYTLFDVPADLIGRIFGLDMELLIPVKGKADFELKDGKFFFHELKDSYSEGKRSKFFLASKGFPHTMDLEGNLNIHVQMKQYVLFKFTEPFILSIEGDLNDPIFSLKKKKNILSSK